MIDPEVLRDVAIEVMGSFLRSPEGRAMIFEEAEKVRVQLGVTDQEFRRGFSSGVRV